MRRPTLMAALVAATALAGCTVTTPEGAACSVLGGTGECPEGQRCGRDLRCSVAAVACEHIDCSATTCNGNALERCVATGPCSTIVEDACSINSQACDAANETCQCGDAQGCTGAGTMCSGDRTSEIACAVDAGCAYRVGTSPCASGKSCQGEGLAGGCACPLQAVEVGRGCLQVNATACATAGQVALECQKLAAASECLVWREARNCDTDGLFCSSGACVCPALDVSGRKLLADPTSALDPTVNPNGAAPALCRFKTLKAAVDAASDGDTVKATGSGVPVSFKEPGFLIKSGVTVVGDEQNPVVPDNVVIELDGIGTQGLLLDANASLRGVTVRRAAGAAATIGIDVMGASAVGGNSLADVVLGKGTTTVPFATDVLVSGTGAVTVQRLTARDATASGLEIARTSIADTVAVSDSTFDGNGVGLKLTRGTLSLVASTVRSSAEDGVVADGGSVGTTRLSISGGTVFRNAGTGLVASLNDSLHLSGVRICANTGALRVLAAGSRTAGGVYLLGDAPADFLFKGNLVHHNIGDQVLVGASGSTRWNLATASCADGERNAFAGYQGSSGDGGLGVAAVSAKVDAWWNAWKTTSLPATLVDFVAQGAGAEVNARGSGAQYCDPPGLLDTDCPP